MNAERNKGPFQKFVNKIINEERTLSVDAVLQQPTDGEMYFGIGIVETGYSTRTFPTIEDAENLIDKKLKLERLKANAIPPIISFGSMFLGMYLYYNNYETSHDVTLLTTFIIFAGLETSIRRYRKFQKEIAVLEAMQDAVDDHYANQALIEEED